MTTRSIKMCVGLLSLHTNNEYLDNAIDELVPLGADQFTAEVISDKADGSAGEVILQECCDILQQELRCAPDHEYKPIQRSLIWIEAYNRRN